MDIVAIEHALGHPIDVATKALGVMSSQGSNPAFEFEDEWIGYSFFRPQGFALSFCDGAFYRDDETTLGDEKILTTVLFYNDESYYHHKDYQGNLPLGIVFSDDHAAVVARLGVPCWKFAAHGRAICARWDVGGYWVLVFYSATGPGIKHVQIGWNPPAPNPPTPLRVKLHGHPDFDVARSFFRRPVSDAELTDALRGFQLSEVTSAKPDDWYVQVDSTTDKGVELFFDQPRAPDPPGDFLFSGVKYFRRGIFGSPGFAGRLPHGIEFSFKPEKLLQLLGNPLTGSANERSGYYVWNFEDYLLHVMFSVQEQRVDRVTVMLHPYHSESFLRDNRLSDSQL
ncbi:hypothetical protein [Burkholderia cenocepacia]|uniref:Uncharacterized protein n=1 Tax=Burkholderia cenocepacia TaxID=95486 RepID=A0A6B2MCK7_9BURK|nr:hypothetical protein [Burkholderia cenocepacia]NDV73505.1 hypothetical protein [Burkholderia cenocepacia]